ncbi:MAG: FkbM family methyltransferase [Chitinophagaceae bacterium]
MPLRNYINLGKNVKNWPLYFRRKYFKPPDNAIYITCSNQLEMEVPDHFFYVFKEIFMEDFYETDKLLRHVADKAVIVDIGANVGFFSFLMASKRKNARIYSYEPMENNMDLFRSNLDRNPGNKHSIKAERKAVTGKNVKFVKLFFDDVHSNTVISSIYEDFSNDNTKATEIEAISLDEIIRNNGLSVIDVLKLDCEGSEYPILYDSPASVWPLIKCLCIEVHEMDKEKRNYQFLSGFLKQKGYQQSSRLDANGCYYVFAWK